MTVPIPLAISVASMLFNGAKTANEPSAPEQSLASLDQSFADLVGGASDDPRKLLEKITSKGVNSMWAWEVEKIKKKAASDVMQEMNLTPEQIAAMPPEARMSVEQKILDEVERRVRELVEQAMNKKKDEPFGFSAGKIDSDAMQALLQTQEIAGS